MPAEYSVYRNGVSATGVTIPRTEPKATPIGTRHVQGVRAIRVQRARYRNATLNGVFEMVSEEPYESRGQMKVEVCCGWFGHQCPTNFPQLILDDDNCHYSVISNYTGEVVDNLGLQN